MVPLQAFVAFSVNALLAGLPELFGPISKGPVEFYDLFVIWIRSHKQLGKHPSTHSEFS